MEKRKEMAAEEQETTTVELSKEVKFSRIFPRISDKISENFPRFDEAVGWLKFTATTLERHRHSLYSNVQATR